MQRFAFYFSICYTKHMKSTEAEREYAHEYYLQHRTRAMANAKAHYAANRELHNGYGRRYYNRHRKERLEYAKRYGHEYGKRLIKHHGEVILRNVNKPPKPTICSLCKRTSHLAYHHWEDEKPEIGLWVCNRCHWAIHRMIKAGLLEPSVESQKLVG